MDSATAAAAQFAELQEVIHNILVTKYTYVAAATILFWDIFITFDQEVSRVWLTRNSLGRTLFLVNRYVAPALFIFDLIYQLHPSPSMTFCKNSFLPPSLLGIAALGSVEFILVMRTYALYQSKLLLAALTFLCLASVAAMMGSTIYMHNNLVTNLPLGAIPLVPGCPTSCTSPLCRTLLIVFWIPFFVLETTIFGLTVWKSFRSFHMTGIEYSTNLVTMVYRDGLIYYIVIMAISITNLVVWIVAPMSMAYLATSLMRCLQVTICSRLLLNIRGILEPQYLTSQISTIGFSREGPVVKSTMDTEVSAVTLVRA